MKRWLAAGALSAGLIGAAVAVWFVAFRGDSAEPALAPGIYWVFQQGGSDDEQTLVFGGEGVPNRQLGPTGNFLMLALSADGQRLAYLEGLDTPLSVTILDVESGDMESIELRGIPVVLDWAPDSKTLAIVELDGMRLVDVEGDEVASTDLSRFPPTNWTVEWSADSGRLAALGPTVVVLDLDGSTTEANPPLEDGHAMLDDWDELVTVVEVASRSNQVWAWNPSLVPSAWIKQPDRALQPISDETVQEARTIAGVSDDAFITSVPVEPEGNALLFSPGPSESRPGERIEIIGGVVLRADSEMVPIDVPDGVEWLFGASVSFADVH